MFVFGSALSVHLCASKQAFLSYLWASQRQLVGHYSKQEIGLCGSFIWAFLYPGSSSISLAQPACNVASDMVCISAYLMVSCPAPVGSALLKKSDMRFQMKTDVAQGWRQWQVERLHRAQRDGCLTTLRSSCPCQEFLTVFCLFPSPPACL